MKPTPRPALRALSVVLLALASLSFAAAQNDPDIDLLAEIEPGAPAYTRVALLDAETDAAGRLVVAYGTLRSAASGWTLRVASRDNQTRSWQILLDMPLGPAGRSPLLTDISLTTVPDLEGIPDNHHAFVAIAFNHVKEPNPNAAIAWFGGPTNAPWSYVASDLAGQIVHTGWSFPTNNPRRLHPSIAVAPLRRGSFRDYAVAIAFSRYRFENRPWNSIDLVWMELSAPGYSGPKLSTIAGPSGTLVEGDLTQPHLVTDQNSGVLGLAFDTFDARTGGGPLHVVRIDPASNPSYSLVFSTRPGDVRHQAHLAAEEGRLNLTASAGRGYLDSAWPLHHYVGDLFDPASWIELPRVHGECRTAGDLEMHRNDVYIAAQCWDPEMKAYRVWRFEGRRDDTSRGPAGVIVSDAGGLPRLPRVASEPPGTAPAFRSVLWSNEVVFGAGGPKPLEALVIDP